ncbi:hypothetical protein GCM10022207_88360 [Streptomyces lannensis]|uniref:Uncharacterized protein n=1 Tax=Streptomyces lannensis TaxID=766498 RepID=A0ABP7LSL2_9ACTN
MRHPFPLTAAQLQTALLGHGLLAVDPGGFGEQREHGLALFGREFRDGLEGAGQCRAGGVVAGHGYEGKGRTGEKGGKGNALVTPNPLLRYAR